MHAKLSVCTLGVLTVLLAGCQTTPTQWREDVREKLNANLEEGKARPTAAAVPNDVSKALLPPLEIAIPDGKTTPPDARFNFAVSAAPARQVFIGLVEGSPYDVVVQPSVGGTITLNLKDVTVPEAFKAMRDAYGYEYRREGNRFIVLGRELQLRLFTVNYLNLTRKGRSDTRVSGGGIGQRSSGTSGSSNSSASGQSGFSSVDLETQSQMDFWKDIQITLSALVGTDGGRKVVVNAQTGVVAVRAMPDELRMIEEYLGATHATVNRQVVLETKVIEVELNDRFQTGINWSAVQGNYTASQVGGGTPNLSTTGGTPFAGTSGALLPGSVGSLRSSATLSDAFGGIFTLTVLGNDFTALVELLRAQGEVQVLSSPRVSAVNNQKAVIKVGADEFFVTGVSSTTTNTTTGSSSPTVELSSFFSGIV
ncbi:MAG TPA: secretin N-terminal domain-containing protein, partial [Burkholderiales bacterium]|nr:secretin N-terminal domain-containing protein [Burkholderiales bacterium]